MTLFPARGRSSVSDLAAAQAYRLVYLDEGAMKRMLYYRGREYFISAPLVTVSHHVEERPPAACAAIRRDALYQFGTDPDPESSLLKLFSQGLSPARSHGLGRSFARWRGACVQNPEWVLITEIMSFSDLFGDFW